MTTQVSATSRLPASQLDDLREWQTLQDELGYIDLLIRREVRRWVVAGQDPNDDYRGLYVTQVEAEQLLERPFGVSWGQTIALPPDEEAAFAAALQQARQPATTLRKPLGSQARPSRLHQLAAAFDLDRTALDLFLLCLAPALDTKYERLYGYLQDNVMRRRPTVRLLLDLLGEPGAAKFVLTAYLAQDAPLFQHRLLEYVTDAPPNNMHWINQTVQVDEGVVAWLLGHYQPHNDLQGHITLTRPTLSALDRLLSGDGTLQRIQAVTDKAQVASQSPSHLVTLSSSHPLFILTGIDRAAQDAVARWLAVQWQQELLTVTLTGLGGEKPTPQQTIQLALCEARLTGASLYVTGWDACLDEERQAPKTVVSALCTHPG